MLPRILFVAGVPGAGKTSVASLLASHLGWTLLSKDRFKELCYEREGYDLDTLPNGADILTALAYSDLEKSLRGLLGIGKSALVEADFQPDSHFYVRARKYAATYPSVLLYVRCNLEVERKRLLARTVESGTRHALHFHTSQLEPLEETLSRVRRGGYEVDLSIAKVEVDTSYVNAVDVPRIVSRIEKLKRP